MAAQNNNGNELLLTFEDETGNAALELLRRRRVLTEEQRRELAAALAKHLADYLCLAWGGVPVYIPKDASRRAEMIYAEFDGSNHQELARKYSCCVQNIYKIIKRISEAKRLRQGNLFDA